MNLTFPALSVNSGEAVVVLEHAGDSADVVRRDAGRWQGSKPTDDPGVTVAQVALDIPSAASEVFMVSPQQLDGEVFLVRDGQPRQETERAQAGGSTARPHPLSQPRVTRRPGFTPSLATRAGRERLTALDAAKTCAEVYPCKLSGWIVVRSPLDVGWWRLDVRTPVGAGVTPAVVRPVELAVVRSAATLSQQAPESRQSIAVDGAVEGTTLLGFVDAAVTAQRNTPKFTGGIRAKLVDSVPAGSDEGTFVADGGNGRGSQVGPTVALGSCRPGACDDLALSLTWGHRERSGEIDVEWRVFVAAVRTDGRAAEPVQLGVR